MGEPMEFVALQAINNMTETSPNLPEDLQQVLVSLREATVQGFENCNEIQTTTIWQYKKCAATQLRMVTMTLTAIQREAELRAAAEAETSDDATVSK